MAARKFATISGVKWLALSRASRVGGQLLATVVLARLLPAADFGLLGMATVAVALTNVFVQIGAGSAVIQRPNLTPQFLQTAFWLTMMAGTAATLGLAALSPAVAWAFAEPRITPVVCVLALGFVLEAFGSVHRGLLERASRFRFLSLLETTAAWSGAAVAVSAAIGGWGVYSLVAQVLAFHVLATPGMWAATRWMPGWGWSRECVPDLLKFTKNFMGFNIVNHVARNADNWLVGRFLGATSLGYYAMAYRLMLAPTDNFARLVSRVLLPVLCDTRNEATGSPRVGLAYLRVLAATVFVTAPIAFGLFASREVFVEVVLGARWKPVGDLLMWLAPVGLIDSVIVTTAAIYITAGRTDIMFRWGALRAIVFTTAFVVGLQWGLQGIAAGYCVASLLLLWPSLAIPLKLLNVGIGACFQAIWPSIGCAVVMAGIVVAADSLLPTAGLAGWVRLAALVMTGMIAYGALSLAFQRSLVTELVRALALRQQRPAVNEP